MFKKKEPYQGAVDQYGRPIGLVKKETSDKEDRKLARIVFTVLGVTFGVVLVTMFLFNYMVQNRLEIPSATLSTTDWTNQDITVTVDTTRGNIKEYSFDDGKTWQTKNTLTVSENQALILRVRNDKGEVSKPATITISNIDKSAPKLYFISPYYVKIGSAFDGKINVYASDSESGLIDYLVDDSSLNMNVPGTYSVSYQLSDAVGNVTTGNRTVIVYEGDLTCSYRSRTVQVGKVECPYECECILPTNESCPAGKHVSEDKTQCCNTCTENCEQVVYGDWSDWNSVKMVPTDTLEVEMLCQ